MDNPWSNDYSSAVESGGGGFFDTSRTDSPGTGKKKDAPRRAQQLVPLVIGMLNESEGEDFKYWGEHIHLAKLIAIVRKYEVTSTKVTYQLEDHTGRISGVLWLEQESDSQPKIPVQQEGVYCRVFGTIRNQSSEKMLMILRIQPIQSINEITTHLLEVLNVRYKMEYGSQNESIILRTNNPGASLQNSMTSFTSNMGGGGKDYGMTQMQTKVFKIIKSSENRIGIHRDQIAEQFTPNQKREVMDSIEYLVSEGHVFSTINADHFKVTDV